MLVSYHASIRKRMDIALSVTVNADKICVLLLHEFMEFTMLHLAYWWWIVVTRIHCLVVIIQDCDPWRAITQCQASPDRLGYLV